MSLLRSQTFKVSEALWAPLNSSKFPVESHSAASCWAQVTYADTWMHNSTGYNFSTPPIVFICCNPSRAEGPRHDNMLDGWCCCASVPESSTLPPASSTHPPAPSLPPLSAHPGAEDEGAEHQDAVSHPLHRPLPARWSRRVWRAGVGQREFKEEVAGAEAERAEEEVRLHRGWLRGDRESGRPGGAAPRRQAVEVHRLLLLCHHGDHHDRWVGFYPQLLLNWQQAQKKKKKKKLEPCHMAPAWESTLERSRGNLLWGGPHALRTLWSSDYFPPIDTL